MRVFTIRKIFFDTETSGLDFINDRIIEFAMIVVENGSIIDSYDEFINIGKPISQKITDITGITNERLRTKGVDEKKVACAVKERITDNTLMIAHNCQFDLLFLYQLLKRNFPDDADEIISNLKWLDTLTVLKDRKKYPHTLSDAVECYRIEKVNFHRAVDDTKALYYVTLAMKEERNDLKEYINIFGFNPKYGVCGPIVPGIKYYPQRFRYMMAPQDEILPRIFSDKRIR
ncbi:PolC-type DNA polymerase III [Methanobrevibacter sp.]|uniref:3'-5' exonuclease n=1 Tax=Methanobrevibacter sp. TaxID=66852 RepID=UPI00386FE8DC